MDELIKIDCNNEGLEMVEIECSNRRVLIMDELIKNRLFALLTMTSSLL